MLRVVTGDLEEYPYEASLKKRQLEEWKQHDH